MNQESPFENYLSGRATELDVPGAGATAVAELARSRRKRRRTGSAAVLGAAFLLGGGVIAQGLRADDASQDVESYGAALGTPALDWTMVDVGNGLGWARDLVRSDSGTLYAVSTGAGSPDSPDVDRSVVYSSTDGGEWAPADMPHDVRVNGLAASGDTIYAVGTGAGGGKVRVAAGAEGDWTVTDLPLDLEAESAGLPGRLHVAETDVANTGGTTVVAATVALLVDTESLVAAEDNPSEWYAERDGMVRWACEGTGGDGAGGPVSTTTAPALTEAQLREYLEELDAAGSEGEREAFEDAGLNPDSADCGESARQMRTWAELGIDPEVGELVTGEVRLFVSTADGPGDPSAVPTFDQVTTLPGGYGTQVLAGDSGFWVVNPAGYVESASGVAMEATDARWSPDGIDWSAAPVTIDGGRWASGEIDGAQQVLTGNWSTRSVVLHRLGAGSVSSVDLSDVADLSEDRYFAAAEIGPLGLVLVTNSPTGHQQVLHSADGMNYGRTDVPAALSGKKHSVNGVTMSADAVKVRLNVYPAGDTTGGPPEGQRLFVGTP